MTGIILGNINIENRNDQNITLDTIEDSFKDINDTGNEETIDNDVIEESFEETGVNSVTDLEKTGPPSSSNRQISKKLPENFNSNPIQAAQRNSSLLAEGHCSGEEVLGCPKQTLRSREETQEGIQ